MASAFWTGVLAILCAVAFTSIMANDEALKAVAKSNTEFTSALYNALSKSNQGNLIFSPFSLSAVAAMIKAGARGQTATDLQTSLKFPSSDDTLNQGYNALLSSLKSDGENFTLETANKIYTQKGFEIKPEFTSTLQKYYNAQATQLDFAQSAAAAKEINTFVETTTHDKIKDLISPSDLDGLTRLVLVNAIYFKGLWKNKFNPQLTREADFHVNSNETLKVQMMKLEADLPYGEIPELNCKAVALPYKGDRLSMIILLPNEVEGLKDMETKLQSFSLSKIPGLLRERKINLSMPKFTLESTIDLQDPLRALGAGIIFDQSRADFSGITSKEQLYVSKAIQKAFIEVNEEGSEAAAATGIQVSVKSAFSGPRLFVNHPFVSMIIENDTSAVLFVSTYSNPTQTQTRLMTSMRTRDDNKSHSGSTIPTAIVTLLPSFVLIPLVSLFMNRPHFF